MYCINCGVKLADTEEKCPLCNTVVYHPDIPRPEVRPLYPKDKIPKPGGGSKVLCGMVLIIFLVPLVLSFLSDLQPDGVLNWFGYVAGGLVLAYVIFALPFWFRDPNPVIFVPSAFVTLLLYLLHINAATDGNWFLSFAFPVAGILGLIISADVALFRYLKKGKLYILGGTFIAIGSYIMLFEFFLNITFDLPYLWWAIYPLTVFTSLGIILIYLGISKSAREIMERKLFF